MGLLAPRHVGSSAPGLEPVSPALAGGFFFFFFLINLFSFGCIGSLLLHTGFSLVGVDQGLLFVAVHGLLIVVASLVAEHRL